MCLSPIFSLRSFSLWYNVVTASTGREVHVRTQNLTTPSLPQAWSLKLFPPSGPIVLFDVSSRSSWNVESVFAAVFFSHNHHLRSPPPSSYHYCFGLFRYCWLILLRVMCMIYYYCCFFFVFHIPLFSFYLIFSLWAVASLFLSHTLTHMQHVSVI